MAVIAPTITQLETLYGHAHLVTWGPFTQADTFTAYPNPGSADRSVHAFGTWGGATLTFKGSNEAGTPTALIGLHDPSGTAISFTADNLAQVSEVTNWITPAISGGAATSLTVAMVVRRPL